MLKTSCLHTHTSRDKWGIQSLKQMYPMRGVHRTSTHKFIISICCEKSHVANMMNVTSASQACCMWSWPYKPKNWEQKIHLSFYCLFYVLFCAYHPNPFLTTYITMLRREMFIIKAWGLYPLIPWAPDVAKQCVNVCGRVFVYDHE